jgi:DNA polymerase-1
VKILHSSSLVPDSKGHLIGLSESEQYFVYNALDCCITFEVMENLDPKLPTSFAYKMGRAMQAPAWTLMERGVRIDMVRRDEVLSSLRAQRARAKHIFFRLTTEGLGVEPYYDKAKDEWFGINYASPQQLQTLFYSLLALPEQKVYDKTTKDRRVTTNREALEKLQTFDLGKPFCDLILAMRDCDKKIQVLESGLENGRMHCGYQVAGPITGRWSSNESAFGSGTNLQNISDEMRRAFIPDKGKKFCQLDLAQAESKLVAHLALPWGDNYLRACNSGDLHTAVTRLVWPDLFKNTNRPDKEIAKQIFYRGFTYRDMAKRGGHGTNYGGTAAVIAMHLKIPRHQAESFQDAYFRAFPEIKKWHDSVRVALVSTRSLTTPLGRVCHFPGRPTDSDTIKSAIAYGPQSSIGDILNLGFYNVWQQFDRIWNSSAPIEILTQVHDSILFQYDPKDEETLIPLISSSLKVPVEISGQTCIIDVDAQVGWNWGKYNELENPSGLKDYTGRDERSPPEESSVLDRRLHSFHQFLK